MGRERFSWRNAEFNLYLLVAESIAAAAVTRDEFPSDFIFGAGTSAYQVLLGKNSHTCNAGAFGEFATGIGNTDAGFVKGTRKLLLKKDAGDQIKEAAYKRESGKS